MNNRIFIEGIPVEKGSQAEGLAQAFQWTLRQQGLKGVCYRTGMKCGAWSLDVYLIPEYEDKPFRQMNCKGHHLIHMKYGYFAKGTNGTIMQEIKNYMRNYSYEKLAKEIVESQDWYLDLEYKGKTIEELAGKDNAAVNQEIETYLEINKWILNDNEKEVLFNKIYNYQL